MKLIDIPSSLREFEHENFLVYCIIDNKDCLTYKFVDKSYKRGMIELSFNKVGLNFNNPYFYDDFTETMRICIDNEIMAIDNKG